MRLFHKKKKLQKSKVGILGGTFNPIHIGHINIAETALLDFELDKVIFMPCYIPPHKDKDINILPGEVRYELVEAAIKKYKNFEVSDYELKNGGVSYSVDTLKALKNMHPENEYYFIIGADSLCQLHTWRDIYTLLELCNFITITRPGYVIDESSVKLKEPWKTKVLQNISKNSNIDISSSNIRRMLHGDEDVGYMLPPDVDEIINERKLYR
jgi:nicotinate-nucleotide adenylyltransferase